MSHPAVLPVNQLPYAELARRGWRVDLVMPASWRHEYRPRPFDSSALPELAARIGRVRVVGRGRPQRHLYLANPVTTIRRLRPRVIFCEEEPFALAAAQWGLASYAAGIPFGVQMDENLDRPLPRPGRAIRTVILRRAAFIAARSETAARLARLWGASGEVSLVPHHIPPWPAVTRSIHDKFTIGFAGRLVRQKGLDTLVAAVRRLEPPLELLVAGDGPLRAWLESANLGGARLRLITRSDHAEMANVYSQMDVLVLPSRTTPLWTEQFGRVLIEAMSCGVPVVGSSSGEIPQLINQTGGGLIFPEGDEGALADRLERLRKDRDLRESLSEIGQAHASEMFSVGAVADRLQDVLDRAITSSEAVPA